MEKTTSEFNIHSILVLWHFSFHPGYEGGSLAPALSQNVPMPTFTVSPAKIAFVKNVVGANRRLHPNMRRAPIPQKNRLISLV